MNKNIWLFYTLIPYNIYHHMKKWGYHMAARFRKSFKIAPGIRLNVSSKSTGLSFGGKGLRYSINSRTGARTTIGGVTFSSSKRKYNSSAYKAREQLRKQKEQQRVEQLQQARYEVALFENQIELIKSIHKECDEIIHWHDIAVSSAPFTKGMEGPNESQAQLLLNQYKPSMFNKIFKTEEKQRNKLADQVQAARLQDQEDYAEWEKINQLAKKIIVGDEDSFFVVIEEMAPLDDLSEFGSGFEFFAIDKDTMEIDFQVHGEHVVPKEQKTLTSTGKLSVKPMSKTAYYDLEQDYICSCALRIARDMFAILPLKYVYINAIDERMDAATGHSKEVTLLSVKIEKEILNRLNFEQIDCSDSMQNFEHRMVLKKTQGLQPVNRLIEN